MTANNLDLIRKFVSGEDTPTVRELYLLALQSAAQDLIEKINNPDFFSTNIKPNLINQESACLFVTKIKLADLFRFDQISLFRIVELAMREAVIGDTPRITLKLSPEGKLLPPSENEIQKAVLDQFADDFLVKELQAKIIKLSLLLGQ